MIDLFPAFRAVAAAIEAKPAKSASMCCLSVFSNDRGLIRGKRVKASCKMLLDSSQFCWEARSSARR